MLTVHHLGKSQSERIVWLCEELAIPYNLKVYERDAHTRLAPPEYKALHPLGTAPIITDGDTVLAESTAIVEYILARYGDGQLTVPPSDPAYADYLYWFHFANGSLQPALMRNMVLARAEVPADKPVAQFADARRQQALALVDKQLGNTHYLAGNVLTAADIVAVFSLTTMRLFYPYDLSPYPNILAYLQRIGARDAYRHAMKKGDPDMEPMLA
ncbi:glutathione S-transferase [Achromobacter sp. ES-001]|uniref:glutathione S-transferase family protein n=1 Tax=Achromobacter sp. ES-001 TaxID=2860286 RepID=UPI001C63F978|nr:glutathione S-transferase [Achromobacter sp. ES-001]QYJ19282.1 glutathione S-transferase [Achromobacter sp. ES-001]